MKNAGLHQQSIEGSSDRVFGLVFAAVFAGVALWPLLYGIQIRSWALALSTAFFALAILRPQTLARLNRAWMQFGLLLNRIVSPVAIGVVYYLGLVPTAMLMRAFGKKPLTLKRDPETTSYWIPRKPPGPDPKSMIDQF